MLAGGLGDSDSLSALHPFYACIIGHLHRLRGRGGKERGKGGGRRRDRGGKREGAREGARGGEAFKGARKQS